MRRPLFIIFCLLLCISFMITIDRDKIDNKENEEKNIFIEGTVKYKKNKEKYDEYIVGEYLVKDYSKYNNLPIGYKVKIYGKLKNINKLKTESFDYGRYLKSCGHKGIIYLNKYDVNNKDYLYYMSGKVRNKIRDIVRYLYKDKSDFLNSILIGEKEFIDKDTKEIFSKTGVSHILALSGLHVGILISIIGFSIGGINRVYKLIILSIILYLYAIMVGQSPSIMRAVSYSTISYLSIFIFKRNDGISSLSLIGSFLVINNPYIIYNISFQLSFLATLSIIYFYGYIKNIVKFKVIAVTISANILTVPIIYLNFKNISVISIISNMLVMPILSVIIYTCIISVLMFPVSLILSRMIVIINSFIIDIMNLILEFLYNLNGSYIEFDNSNVVIVIVYYIAVVCYMILKEIKTVKEQENGLQGYHQEYEQRRI
ncbi:MAG: ComEC/Rec2 family competence protein [Paraclostridium sp.]